MTSETDARQKNGNCTNRPLRRADNNPPRDNGSKKKKDKTKPPKRKMPQVQAKHKRPTQIPGTQRDERKSQTRKEKTRSNETRGHNNKAIQRDSSGNEHIISICAMGGLADKKKKKRFHELNGRKIVQSMTQSDKERTVQRDRLANYYYMHIYIQDTCQGCSSQGR